MQQGPNVLNYYDRVMKMVPIRIKDALLKGLQQYMKVVFLTLQITQNFRSNFTFFKESQSFSESKKVLEL